MCLRLRESEVKSMDLALQALKRHFLLHGVEHGGRGRTGPRLRPRQQSRPKGSGVPMALGQDDAQRRAVLWLSHAQAGRACCHTCRQGRMLSHTVPVARHHNLHSHIRTQIFIALAAACTRQHTEGPEALAADDLVIKLALAVRRVDRE